ncbi:MAG: SDR family NAD(P)-dependent oxidoreductase [Pseudomonadota bacterium]
MTGFASVALVGASCRLPGAAGLEPFWSVLSAGRNVISTLDEARFGTRRHLSPNRTEPGRTVTFAAGQIDNPYHFDHSVFGISPREAVAMDPQQRLMLEVAVEAMEDAGIPVDGFAGKTVGVYVGASALDNAHSSSNDPALTEPQSMLGNTLSIIANRISYVLDLRGPSFVVDTACSSSLIALHKAVEDLQLGRIEAAVVGGVSLLLHPIPFIGFSRATMLSANGLCRPFDAAADGYVRSEGAVALVLRREDLARESGDRIRARFVASGTNADGRTTGLSLPSANAQRDLLTAVYSGAGIDPNALSFVEAHGTGTPVGDPIECQAIGEALAVGRQDVLPIGSSKSNFGHLEPASGLVGVLKAAMALERDVFPASILCDTPNPNIDFGALNLSVAREAIALPRGDGPRLAGINSFGFGGANAHVVIADGDPLVATPPPPPPAPLMLTAATEKALAGLCAAHAAALEAGADPAHAANAAAYGRQRRAHRAVVLPAAPATMAAALSRAAAGEKSGDVLTGEAHVAAEAPVFVYAGNGSQWAGMGREAYTKNAAFKTMFDEVNRRFMKLAGWSLVTALFSADLETELGRTEVAQPLLFALQVALTDALVDAGLKPAVVMGHSVGEVAAAWASGALTLSDAILVIHARSTHQEMTRHLGGMAAAAVSAADAEAAIAPFAGLEVAAVNAPRSVTLSGPVAALDEFKAAAKKKRLAIKRLALAYPFHCALVDPIRDPLLASLAPIAPRAGTCPMVSSVTGAAIDGTSLDPQYWWSNARQPVRFMEALQTLLANHSTFVEIGPQPILTGYLTDTARSEGTRAAIVPSLTQKLSGDDPIGRVIAAALAHGAAVDDGRVFGPKTPWQGTLPKTPWQHTHHRVTHTPERVRLLTQNDHPLLGDRLRFDQTTWYANHDAVRLPFLADHAVDGAVVFPAAGYVEMLLGAGRVMHGEVALEVRNLDIVTPMVLEADSERDVRTRATGGNTFIIESRRRFDDGPYTIHVQGSVAPAPAAPTADAPLGPITATKDGAAIYVAAARFGLNYGPAFQKAASAEICGAGEARVHLSPSDDAVARENFCLDPTLFDSVFHGLFALLDGQDGGDALLPVRLERLTLAANAAPPVSAELRVTKRTERVASVTFVLKGADGSVVGRADGVRFQRVPLARGGALGVGVSAPTVKWIGRLNETTAITVATPDADPAEPSESALLLEAGVQAAAAEALAHLFAAPRRIEDAVRAGALSRAAVPLAARLLEALSAAGEAEEADGAWTVSGGEFGVSDVVQVLFSDHPQRLAEATVLAELPALLAQVLENGAPPAIGPRAPGLQHLLTDAPFNRPLCDALVEAANSAIASAGAAPVKIVCLRAHDAGLIAALTAGVTGKAAALVVSDPDEATLSRHRIGAGPTPGHLIVDAATIEAEGGFDLAIIPPGLSEPPVALAARALKPGGTLLAADHTPSLFADVVFTTASGAADGLVLGARNEADWIDALAAAFDAPSVHPIPDREADGALIVATATHRIAEPAAEAPAPALYALGKQAGRVMEAVRAQFEPRPEICAIEAVAPGDCVIAADVETSGELAGTLHRLGDLITRLSIAPRRVTVVTFGALATDTRPTAAALAAFVRVAANEFGDLDVRLVDVSPQLAASEAAVRLRIELAQPNGEREIALASDHRGALRHTPEAVAGDGEMAQLTVLQRGSIDALAYRPATHPALGPRDVRLKVEATGLNFRDVMWTLGLLPEEALEDGFAGPTLGMECAAIVEAVGEGVTDLAVGDGVVAFAPACFASHVTVDARAVVKRPAGMDPFAVATIPVAFLTASYALNALARVEAGETVLVHGGAGGIGLAALQIALGRGATVYATAGSPHKRAFLERLGAEAVFSSRAHTFEADVMAATGGAGVDIVVNSLAGEAMERSVAVLKPFGRFLELGKRDFYADTKLGLRPFRQNLSYFGIDADQLMAHRPDLAKTILTDLMAAFEDGSLSPLPYRAFPAEGVRDAFRLMQSAGHMGKIVVAPPEAPARAKPPAILPAPGDALLLVGGTSGFGFATAEFLIENGARHLILASRSGITDPAIHAAVARHRAAGVTIEVTPLDVTDHAAVATLVASIREKARLSGVFHMPVVLDDALIPSLDEARHAAALAPKVAGWDALEAALAGADLDMIVLYSSMTVALGNPGQANYVAANAYLEGVARRLRAAGKPALAIAWGAITDTGVFARNAACSDTLKQKLGRHAMTAAEGFAAFKTVLEDGGLTRGEAVRTIARIDWARIRTELPLVRTPAFEDVVPQNLSDDGGQSDGDLLDELKTLAPAEAKARVSALLQGEVSQILKVAASEVDGQKPLTALGMDSLMGLELKMAAEQRLGIDIPLMSLASGMSLDELAQKIVDRVTGGTSVDGSVSDAVRRHLAAGDGDAGDVDAIARRFEAQADTEKADR